MNNTIVQRSLAVAGFLGLACFGTPPQAGAQQLTIYGKFDWGTAAIAGGTGSVAAAKGSRTNAAIQGNLVQGAYRITSATSTANIVPGMQVSGAGIPAHAIVVDVSGSTISISKPITASATGTTITTGNDNATLVTAHSNGLGGSLPGFATCSLDSGIHYTFNGATGAPFPAQANGSASGIYAGKLLVNAAVSINKQVYVADVLTLSSGNLTIPAGDSLVITSGQAIAGAPFSSTKHIITAANTSNGAQGFLGANNITASFLFPVGSAARYLPVTLAPASAAAFVVGAFEGITENGQPNGTAFTAAKKANVVNAVWTILRADSNRDSATVTLEWPQVLEGSSFSADDSIGIAGYSSTWNAAGGTGNNTANTAGKRFNSFSAFSVGRKTTVFGESLVIAPGNLQELAAKQAVENSGTAQVSRLYPNPVTDQLVVEHTLKQGHTAVVIYDALGRVVRRQTANALKTFIPVASLQPGVYTITLSDGTNTVTKKFVKQ
jgi:hypothetical protein